ncbi:phosphoglucosamine mutase [Desulfofustis glycolicus]|uniref:Phosphoglucosamine mutase n=1 Tax=Desulfofustis glycolicus DSM 9705 TaxID=1121409 RepID=A0A1M5XN30_9BACT|nr:phosphoglucosamine mutase [Desulfofustis glycolicus]MCB2218630.1 phosphoglucosamine mutase [Desulfobulbaceae bacterium]SHI01237.1 phosphoglucosamine mutase [Desulfofustis glycolicus DSM 9705]
MRRLFGTDGIRGEANTHPMTTEIAMQVGRAIAFIVKDRSRGHGIVIGKDTRLSCYMLENALAAGICSMGVDVMLVGPLPTPGISFITTSMRADAGVVISASHNPFQDNGIKIFTHDGFKLPDDVEEEIEDLIFSQKMEALRPVAAEVGKAERIDDAKGRYIVFLKSTFPKQYVLDDFHIVLDCANGATYGVAPHVFEELGAKVTALAVKPDGTNINRRCGALHPELMAEAVRAEKADIGLAFDGDGDRLIVCDERGQIVDGDHIMAICAKDLLKQRKLKKKTLVATVMSNLGLEVAIEGMGGTLVRTAVGDRYVVECMRQNGYSFGGEQSGHLIFLDDITTGDGILAGLQLLSVMKKQDRPLSELATVMESFPQVLKNVRTKTRMSIDEIPHFTSTLRKLEEKLNTTGRILVRPSGTEPVIRVMVEGQDEELINDMADELCELVSNADRM